MGNGAFSCFFAGIRSGMSLRGTPHLTQISGSSRQAFGFGVRFFHAAKTHRISKRGGSRDQLRFGVSAIRLSSSGCPCTSARIGSGLPDICQTRYIFSARSRMLTVEGASCGARTGDRKPHGAVLRCGAGSSGRCSWLPPPPVLALPASTALGHLQACRKLSSPCSR